MRLTLLVPELIWPEPGDTQTLGQLAAPGFGWLAGHARLLRSTAVSFENSLLAQFAASDAAIAPLRLRGEQAAADPGAEAGQWLCADPVHLRFHHERIVLADAAAFDLDEAEAQALVAALNAEFTDIGVFHAATPRRWYLRLNVAVDHVAEPLSAIAGRRMDSELADKTSPLYRWLNEVQMFLHLHPVNEQRAAQGKPAINSLWLWGNGRAKSAGGRVRDKAQVLDEPENRGLSPVSDTVSATVFATRPDAVFSNDPLAIGLARSAGLAVQPRPSSLADVLDCRAQRPLVVLDQLLPTVLYENPEGWRQAFADLENHWFAPLRGQLGKSVKNLDIVAPTIYGLLQWTIPGSERWKFWKKGRTPADIASALAATPQEGSPS